MKNIKKMLSIVLCISVVIGLMPILQVAQTKAATTTTRYEAEEGDISGAQTVNSSVSNASGKKGVVCRPTQYLVLTVNVSKDGDYIIPVRYATGNNISWDVIPVEFTVNGEVAFSQDFQNTGTSTTANGWNTFATQEVTLSLKEGDNVIIMKNNSEGDAATTSKFITFDYIEITQTDDTPVVYPAAIGRHEAENAQDLGGNSATIGDYYAQCSNSGIVGVGWFWIGNTKNHIAWTVDAEEAGDYLVTLSYCAPKVSEFLIKVNNEDWVPFDDEMDIVGKVAPATGTWNTTATIKTVVTLVKGANTISVSGPAMDNSTGDGNFFTVYESSTANISSANIDCIDIEKYVSPTYSVEIDGTETAKVEKNAIYTLPTDAEYGYFDGTNMYKPGDTVTVTSDIVFTSVNELSVTVAQGAGIRLNGSAGIRFRATAVSDNMDALASDAITEGMLITANDLYENLGNSTLDLSSTYPYKNIDNSGWFDVNGNGVEDNDEIGTYCGSIVNIMESNYIRNFIARAYVTITYTDGETLTVYSKDMSSVRSIAQVAQNLIAAGALGNYTADEQNTINAFATAK
ncbi:MAG: hypothetical protein ACLRZ9_03040 [Eubacterium sp.]